MVRSSWQRRFGINLGQVDTERVFEVEPLEYKCGGVMKIIIFIESGQCDVAEGILRHCGLWEGPIRTLASVRGPLSRPVRHTDHPRELQLVPDPEYL